ncbi:MAG: phosphoribosylanthranilate isomerase [Magnetococcales bacterium]|nr:phosphoribosylanthranilate isomerase [Magnetococcales bacterium]NGZ28296.1 phosphoribosylanthranilate isomerase [Magnetococcales bacterium]
MIRVKVCGITSIDDGLAAVEAGADAIGLVFYPPSPRHVSPQEAAEIVAAMPPFVTVVGLFVNMPALEIGQIVRHCRLEHIQLHGDESPEECRNLPVRVIKAVRVASPEDLLGLDRYPVEALLLDAKVKGLYGGSGQRFDWHMIESTKLPKPVILAGGLEPDNVAQAVSLVRPYAVDVSSGVERAPGIKDFHKMVAFIQAARQ